MRVIARMSGGAAHQVRVLTDELSSDRLDRLYARVLEERRDVA